MAEEETEAPAGEEEAAPKSKKKLIIIIAVVVLLIGGGGAGFALMGGSDEPSDEESHEEAEKHYETIELDTFIVNLSENSSFLKVKMILEFNPDVVYGAGGGHGEGGGHGYGGGGAGGGGESEGHLPGILGEREPMVRDAILRVLSSKRAEEVLTLEGKETLKEELIEGINEATGLDEEAIVNIYFVEFIIQ